MSTNAWQTELAPASRERHPLAEVAVAFALLEAALWTPAGILHWVWVVLTAACVLAFTCQKSTARKLGLRLPVLSAWAWILGIGLGAAVALWIAVWLLGWPLPALPGWPSRAAALQYSVWALLQQFMLQSLFFVRLESPLGGRKAVWLTALLFASAHLPSPILTLFTIPAGLFFCEMFRRYRSIYPLGIVHAVLGLTVAYTIPPVLLDRMRVGIAFLQK
jgi:membrane protease YdiL (CAAX protease family)